MDRNVGKFCWIQIAGRNSNFKTFSIETVILLSGWPSLSDDCSYQRLSAVGVGCKSSHFRKRKRRKSSQFALGFINDDKWGWRTLIHWISWGENLRFSCWNNLCCTPVFDCNSILPWKKITSFWNKSYRKRRKAIILFHYTFPPPLYTVKS